MRRLACLSALICLLTLPAFAQTPVLAVAGAPEKTVIIKSLSIEVTLSGTVAQTTLDMTFFNTSNRILEGSLTFPLPEGVSVNHYALDINGLLRDAVPVDRSRGTEVFEAIERRGVDPGLLEKAEGNNFRTRIYPIPANGSRRIRIGYQQELKTEAGKGLVYFLPLRYPDAIPDFHFSARLLQSASEPELLEKPDFLELSPWQQGYLLSLKRSNFKPEKDLRLRLPKKAAATEILVQRGKDGNYFVINHYINANTRQREFPDSVSLVWDVSYSGRNRNHEKELELLELLFKQKKRVTVRLYALNQYLHPVKTFTIRSGEWTELKKMLRNLTYDGGTDFTQLYSLGGEIWLFTDGFASGGIPFTLPAGAVLYPVTAAASSDYSTLQRMAQQTGGELVNLNENSVEAGAGLLLHEPYRLISTSTSKDVEEVYPSLPTTIQNSISVAGRSSRFPVTITLNFGYGNKISSRKTVTLTASDIQEGSTGINAASIWAQKKIAELDLNYTPNRSAIEQLGRNFGIVTRNTSLIVLETVWDYVMYEIEPPADLRDQYDRILKERAQQISQQKKAVINNAAYYFDAIKTWYGVEESEKEGIQTVRNTVSRLRDSAGSRTAGSAQRNANGIANQEAGSFGHSELSEVVVVGYGTARRRDITGSVSVVSSRDLNGFTNVAQALQGRVAGVQVIISPGNLSTTETQIRIRGVSSFTNNNPTIVIDGMYATMDDLMRLSPNDIETITIQKDGSYIPGSYDYSPTYYNSGNRNRDPRQPKIKWRKLKYFTDTSFARYRPLDLYAAPEYIKTLEKTAVAERYAKYLELRNAHEKEPAFFFSIACWFFEQEDFETGLTILYNLAELNLQDHELYKMIAYKFRELEQYELALPYFRKILEWRPMEPQSYRDYGLCLQDGGYYQQALDTLTLALTRNYSGDVRGLYPGIEEMLVTEINQLIALHGKSLNLLNVPKELILSMPVDLRVVLNWNMNDSDMDLWVTDPNGEKAYYGHKNTQISGRLSNDFTRGYGPEQFMLKRGVKGTYKVELNYFGDRIQKVVGPVTVSAEIYTHYGSPNQERRIVTLQLNKTDHGGKLIAEFRVD